MSRPSKPALLGLAAAAIFAAGVAVASLATGTAPSLVGTVGSQSGAGASDNIVLTAATPAATPTCQSNQGTAHEKAESAAREAQENSGNCGHFGMRGGHGPGGFGSNEDPTHEQSESPAREAQEGAATPSASPTPSSSTGI
jgi:hypothetical protein